MQCQTRLGRVSKVAQEAYEHWQAQSDSGAFGRAPAKWTNAYAVIKEIRLRVVDTMGCDQAQLRSPR